MSAGYTTHQIRCTTVSGSPFVYNFGVQAVGGGKYYVVYPTPITATTVAPKPHHYYNTIYDYHHSGR